MKTSEKTKESTVDCFDRSKKFLASLCLEFFYSTHARSFIRVTSLSLALSHSHTHTFSLSLSHTHTHEHTHAHCPSHLSHTRTLSISSLSRLCCFVSIKTHLRSIRDFSGLDDRFFELFKDSDFCFKVAENVWNLKTIGTD